MARKLPGLRRELDAQSLFSVAYGEIASSIYFALGIIALHALARHLRRHRRLRPEARAVPGDGRRGARRRMSGVACDAAFRPCRLCRLGRLRRWPDTPEFVEAA